MDQKTRFDSIQTRAVELYSTANSLRQECHVPAAASQTVRTHCFKARLLTGLMQSNAVTAMFTLRKQSGAQMPEINAERDFETFQERVAGIAGAEGLPCAAVADAIMHAAELLLANGEIAVLEARTALEMS